MYNNVVAAMVKAFGDKGYSTLRFNFRGAGRSQGVYDEGDGECEDVSAAVSFLRQAGVNTIHLAGYSFGAWVNSRLDFKRESIESMIMISPPVALIPFDENKSLGRLERVVTGSRDDIAPPDMIRKWMPVWNPDATLTILEGADHFYMGHTEELESILTGS
jgi:hypothetical protein